ncbi:MAG: sugar ABC transporter permease [Clostridia bacterium]|nr:sugar ABC transporter permease [Clostridia bacterium]
MRRRTITSVKLLLLAMIPILGFLLIYVVPLGLTFRYTFTATPEGQTWTDSIHEILQNRYFAAGFRNLLQFGCACLGAGFSLALGLSWLMVRHPHLARPAVLIMILPLLIPTFSVSHLVQELFHIDLLSRWEVCAGALLCLYCWKYTGTAASILYAAHIHLQREVLEAAKLDGCGEWRLFFRVRLPMIRGQVGLSLLFLLMDYFRIYKESYLLFGRYPPDELYLIQHYMANHYLKMDVFRVSVAAASMAVLCLLFFGVAALLLKEKRVKTK